MSLNAADVANSAEKTGDRLSYREAFLREGIEEASGTPSVRQVNEGHANMQNVTRKHAKCHHRRRLKSGQMLEGDKGESESGEKGSDRSFFCTDNGVMERAKANILGKAQGRNLVIVAGGLNDALKRHGGGLMNCLAKRVDELRTVSPWVRITVCMVPEVPLRDITVQGAVVASNEPIWRVGREKGFEVVKINREVHRWGGFQWDGIYFSHRLGYEVGFRVAGRAVAFLEGTRKLRSPG